MGLLEKTEDLLSAKQDSGGLAARARSILRNRREGRPFRRHLPDSDAAGLVAPGRGEAKAEVGGKKLQEDFLAGVAATAPDASIMLAYDLVDIVDPELVEESARKIVEGHGKAQRVGATTLWVILYHMENADPELTLLQFGKALVRTYAETRLPPPGKAFRIDPAAGIDAQALGIPPF